jgi:hypothetical protein
MQLSARPRHGRRAGHDEQAFLLSSREKVPLRSEITKAEQHNQGAREP